MASRISENVQEVRVFNGLPEQHTYKKHNLIIIILQ